MATTLDEHQQWHDSTTNELLVNGSVYIGLVGLDPTVLANQITIYSDRALTTPIANPQTTDANGQTENKIWFDDQKYSISVTDSDDVVKYTELDNGTEPTDAVDVLNLSEGSDIASASIIDIWDGDGNTKHITGTTTITSMGTAPNAGASRWVIFDGALTLTHSASLNLRGGEDITTIAGDMAYVYADTTTQLDVIYYRMDRGPNNINETLVTRSNPADFGIPLAETSRDEISITIPTTWNTYDVEVIVSGYIHETDTITVAQDITMAVREGSGTSGTIIARSISKIGTASPDNRYPAGFSGFIEGETATGSVTWSLTAMADTDSNDADYRDVRWWVRVYRVT